MNKYRIIYIRLHNQKQIEVCLHNFDRLHKLVVFMQSLLQYAAFCIMIEMYLAIATKSLYFMFCFIPAIHTLFT